MSKQPKIIQIWLLISIQLTSHICSWKNLLSFSISSAISAPLISVLIIPCCLACSFFSFSILVLAGNDITGVKDHKHIHDKTKQNKMCHLCKISLIAVSITRKESFSGFFWLNIYGSDMVSFRYEVRNHCSVTVSMFRYLAVGWGVLGI